MSEPTRPSPEPPGDDPGPTALRNDAASRTSLAGPEQYFEAPERTGEIGTFGPRYRVLQPIGKGGMGAVFLGYDQVLRREIALKVMLPRYAQDADSRERFLREARAAARVRSAHVVVIFDVGEHGGVPFIAMEYLLGRALDIHLKADGDLPLVQVLRVARETAIGLAAAHKQGLIHRDIKPGNIWLEAPNGRVKLLDFGLARTATDDEQITGSGAVVGTPAYMSPEQARGQKLDARSDLFSLGTMLYRLCTGNMPFTGAGTMAVLTSLAVDDPIPPRRHNPNVPAALEALVLKLLAKAPADRFQTAEEVIAALEAVDAALAPQVVAIAVPAQAQNVWDGIEASESVPVPLAESAEPVAPAEPKARPARTTVARAAPKFPLALAGGAVALAVLIAGAVALFAWPKKPDAAKKDDPAEPTTGRVSFHDAPPGTEFALKRDGVVVAKVGPRRLDLEPGRYTIEFASPVAPGIKIVPDAIDVTPGSTHRVSVKEEKGASGPPPPDAKVYPLPPDLIAPMTPVKPAQVFTLDYLNPAKHVPPDERYKWQPKELVAVLGSHRQRVPGGLSWVRVAPDGTFALVGHGASTWKVDVKTGVVSDGPSVGVVSADFRRGAVNDRVFDLTDPKAAPIVYSSLGEVRGFLSDDLVIAFRDNVHTVRKLDGKGGADVVDAFTQPAVAQFAVSPDARYLALVMNDETCRVYDLGAGYPKGKFVELPGTEGRTLAYAPTFSYTGLMSTAGRDGDKQIGRVWDVSNGRAKLVASGAGGYLTGDGKYLFTHGNESCDMVRVGASVKPRTTVNAGFGGTFVAGGPSSSRDGAIVVTAQTGGAVRVWKIQSDVLNELNPLHPQLVFGAGAVVSPDGRFAVPHREGRRPVLLNLADLTERDLPAARDAVRFGPDGSVLATSGPGLRLGRAPEFAPAPEFAQNNAPLCFSPDNNWLVSTSETELTVWDVKSTPPRRLWAVPAFRASRADFTPDGRLLIARIAPVPHATKVRVWAMTASGPKLRYETDSFPASNWEALSPDGLSLAVCDHSRGLCVYDIESGVPRARRVIADDRFGECHYSPNGRLLLVRDAYLKVLDASTGAVLYQLPLRGAPVGVRFHPDGKHVLVTNLDGTTYILRLPDMLHGSKK